MNASFEEEDYTTQRIRAQIEKAKTTGLLAFPGGTSPVEPGTTGQLKPAVAKAKAKGLIKSQGLGNHVGLPKLTVPEGTPVQAAAQLVSMKTAWVDVSPEMAADWLLHNICNRPLRKNVVANYARQMQRGEWLPIAQGIAFDTERRLLNGQHRLSAIVESGCTVRLMVTTNVPASIPNSEVKPMDLMDTGLPRSITDQLKIQHGLSGGSILAAIVRCILYWAVPARTWKLSVAEVLMIYRLFQNGIDFVREHRSKEHGLKQAGVLAAFALAMSAEGSTAGQHAELYQQLTGQDPLPHGRPIGQLSRFLRAPDAILLARGNDRALVPLVLGVLEAEQTCQPSVDLKQPADAATLRAALAPQIQQLKNHFDPTRPAS